MMKQMVASGRRSPTRSCLFSVDQLTQEQAGAARIHLSLNQLAGLGRSPRPVARRVLLALGPCSESLVQSETLCLCRLIPIQGIFRPRSEC